MIKQYSTTTFLLYALFSSLGFPNGSAIPEATGTLCIGRLIVQGPIAGPMDRHAATTSTVFKVQIDKLKPVEITSKAGAVVRNLNLSTPHLVAIRSNGELLESFWFDFDPAGQKELCLWYKADYGYWSFMPNERHMLCSCREVPDPEEKPK